MKNLIEISKKDILNKIKRSNYPEGHPFLVQTVENDFTICILALLKIFSRNNRLVDDYVCDKLRSIDNGAFSTEKFFQNLNEVTFLYYLFVSLIKTESIDIAKTIDYESNTGAVGGKIFEYSFNVERYSKILNFEVKTVTCDPIMKEDSFCAKDGDKLIKTFFPKDDLKNYVKDLSEYKVLPKSSLYRQIRSAIEKINSKFNNDESHINIGVIVGQFATSIDEFYSYFLNPKKGIIAKEKRYLRNIDALIFFSLTTGPDLMMDDIYETGHTFTMLLNDEIEVAKILSLFRLDNFAFSDNKIFEPLKEMCCQEFGKYIFKNINGIVFYINEDTTQEELNNYIDLLNDKGFIK